MGAAAGDDAEPSDRSRALWGNRDFVLLQFGQLLSNAGTQLTTIAYPLLTLAVTGSAASAGLVTFARLLPAALFALPFGVLADAVNRRALLVLADATRAAAVGSLAVVIAIGPAEVWVIALLAAVEGAGSGLYSSAAPSALRAVVPAEQLPAAVAVVTGRSAVVQVAGPSVGGLLFGISRVLPFAVDAISYVASMVSVLLIRASFQPAEPDRGSLRDRTLTGVRFALRQPFIRDSSLFLGATGFGYVGLTLVLVVTADRDGWSEAQTGAMVAVFGACLFAGSVLSGFVRRLLPVRAILVLESWMWPMAIAFVAWPHPLVLGLALLPAALAIPSTDSVVHAYRIAVTPAGLLGRSESVGRVISLTASPLGALLAGLLLTHASARLAVLVFVAVHVAVAVFVNTAPSFRGVAAGRMLATT